MMRVALALLIAVCALGARGEGFTLFPYEPAFSDALTRYHRKPNPEQVLDQLLALDLDKLQHKAHATRDTHWRAVLMAFFVNVLHANDDQVMPFARRVVATTESGNKAEFAMEVIARSARQNRTAALGLLATRYAVSQEHLRVYEAMPVGPYPAIAADYWQAVDILWSAYFASGNPLYIEKIFGALAYYEPMGPDQVRRMRAAVLDDSGAIRNGPVQDIEWLGRFLTAQTAAATSVLMIATDPDMAVDFRQVVRLMDPAIATAVESNVLHPDALARIRPFLPGSRAGETSAR